MCFPVLTLELSLGCFFAVWLIIASCGFVFLSGGDKDESEDSVGDLRRTESDSVLKKVGIQIQLLSKTSTPPHQTVSSNFNNTIKMNLATSLHWISLLALPALLLLVTMVFYNQ